MITLATSDLTVPPQAVVHFASLSAYQLRPAVSESPRRSCIIPTYDCLNVLSVVQRWPPCDEELLRNFKWDSVQLAAQHESEADIRLFPKPDHVEHQKSPEGVPLQANGFQATGQGLSAGGEPSSNQGQTSVAGISAVDAHLY